MRVYIYIYVCVCVCVCVRVCLRAQIISQFASKLMPAQKETLCNVLYYLAFESNPEQLKIQRKGKSTSHMCDVIQRKGERTVWSDTPVFACLIIYILLCAACVCARVR